MEKLDLLPALYAAGTVKLPGSKSISNRSLLLAALADGTTHIRDLLASDDTARMLEALQQLGVDLRQTGENDWQVVGLGGAFSVKQAELFLGNAGTAFRPLTAALALSGGHYRLSGVPRMHERPIGDLVDALRQVGADIHYLGNKGFPPLEIRPAKLSTGSAVKIRGDVSSQFLTALLMALPLTGQAQRIEVVGELISKPYIEITLNLMARFGVTVERDGWQAFTIPANSCYTSPGELWVEGDASSASYFLAAGAIGRGPVRIEGVGRHSIQGDIRFAEALELMGATVVRGENWIEASAAGKLKAIELDCNHIPDAAMTLAVAALFAEGTTTLRNIASWRVKETDRIAAMTIELRKVGATVEEGADFIRVTPPATLTPNAVIDTYDDHRMAMCFSLVSLGGVPVTINDPNCVAKTFPDYFERFATITWSEGERGKGEGHTSPSNHPSPIPIIAIDGPTASGKGTVAQRVAEQLGYHYLDSGALYRLVALAALKRSIAWHDETALADMAHTLSIRFEQGEIYLDGECVTDAVRTEEVSRGASEVAVHPAVRAALFELQRSFLRMPGLVADGRDMGSVVFPEAQTKIFLTASAEIRAERRYKQLMEKGKDANLADILQDLQLRDERDRQRSVAPLQQCKDATLLDTSHLAIEQAVQEVLSTASRT